MTTKKKNVEPVEQVEEVDFELSVEALEDSVESEMVDEGFIVSDEPVDSDPMYTVASDGDSYASLAARLAPAGMRAHDYARKLYELNRGVSVRRGMKIRLK